MRQLGETCQACRFWRDCGLNPVPAWSECRRYPPAQFMTIEKIDEPNMVPIAFRNCSSGPKTGRSYWCGEWRAAEGQA